MISRMATSRLIVGRKSVALSAEWDSYGGRRYAFPPYMLFGIGLGIGIRS